MSDLLRRVHESPDDVLARRPPAPADDGDWTDVTTSEFLADVRAIAGGLRASGVSPGDRVLLLSSTHYDWTLVDYAIWYAGAVTVPVYPSTNAPTLTTMIVDCDPALAIVDTVERATLVRECAPDLDVVVLDDAGRERLTSSPATFPPLAEPDDPATIIYTPGTTGDPRGCVLTHRALLASARALSDELAAVFSPLGRTLFVTPLPHVFARVLQIACVRGGVTFAHTRGAPLLVDDLRAVRPTFLAGVPRLFERLYTRASQQAAVEGRARAFERATQVAIAYSRALDSGGPGLRLRTQHTVYDRLVYGGLRATLGDACRIAIAGGAPLGDRLGHFFRGIGMPILEGYVLTETAGAVTMNRPAKQRLGTVGEPLPGVETRIEDDGELMIRSGQLMSGYWHAADATASALTDGWLHTGDLAEQSDDGVITILGRKREVIVTAGGKQIVPTVLEDRIRAHPLIDHVVVVGDGQPFAAALVTLDPEGLESWMTRTGKRMDLDDVVDDSDLRGAVKVAIEQANRTVSPAEAVRRFVVLPTRWTEAGGELTPSLKLRRDVVVRQHRNEIEALFGF